MVALFRDHQNFALSAGHNLRATILVRLIILVDYFVVEDLVLTKLCDYPPVFLLVNDAFEHDQQNVILRVLLQNNFLRLEFACLESRNQRSNEVLIVLSQLFRAFHHIF